MAIQKCSFLTLNVRGLKNRIKRKSIFSYLKDQNCNFYLLQETFSEPKDEAIWKNEWGGDVFFSHGTNHSKGVCILVNPSLATKVENRLYETKARGAILRSKVKWVELGEKPNKYFFNMEKKNYNKKVIKELKRPDGKITVNDHEIMSDIETFYKNLYTSNVETNSDAFNGFIDNLSFAKLSNEDKMSLEGEITREECKNILKTFQNGKSPGEDGYTAEFYKQFFSLLGQDLTDSLNAAFESGEMSVSQRRGVITLIPKEDSDALLLSNWRPITLLNVDYKIASKVIAKRIERVLPYLIHPDQTGFMKGRYIGQNIRLINDILRQTELQKIPGILLLLDFQKAFDTLDWSFIQKTFDLFNFGNVIKR